VGCTIGSREVPGERKPVIRDDDHDDDVCLAELYGCDMAAFYSYFFRFLLAKFYVQMVFKGF
jgi:hypothetical protein